MDQQIKNMIAVNIQTVPVVVEGEGEKVDEARGPEIPDRAKVADIPYGGIVDNGRGVIEMEGIMERIGVNNKSQSADGGRPRPPHRLK